MGAMSIISWQHIKCEIIPVYIYGEQTALRQWNFTFEPRPRRYKGVSIIGFFQQH